MFELRPFQKAALEALERPGHVLCVAPTGSGKSLIFERAARKPGRKTLLISPLVALARQQRARLESEPGIWIVSPEKLQGERFREALRRWRPDFLVVDECHCLWEWGQSFRPAFGLIPPLLGELGISTSLWLTATLPMEARLQLRSEVSPLKELGEFDLPPLALTVSRVPWVERAGVLLAWLEQQKGPGILFVSTRDGAERLARLIGATHRSVVVYHAGMSSEERRAIEERLARGLPEVIVATSAFGLGMHYAQLQWAALWQAPLSLLALAQAIGRVGRDPQKVARALIFWDDEDFKSLEWASRGSESRAEQLAQVRDFLRTPRCRRSALRNYFASFTGFFDDSHCGLCDFCVCKIYTHAL